MRKKQLKALLYIATGFNIIWIPLVFFGAALQYALANNPDMSVAGAWAIYIFSIVVSVAWAIWLFVGALDLFTAKEQ